MKTLSHARMPQQNPSNLLGLSRSFWISHLGLPLLLVLLMLWIYPKTNLDYLLIQPFFDANKQVFTWQHHWLFETLMHTGLKNAVIVIAIFTLGLSVAFRLRRPFNKLTRPTFWTFCAMVMATSIISLLKSQSIHACPSHLTLFGGQQPYLPLFSSLPTNAPAGHCFPGGHASAGFALMAFYFAWRDQHKTHSYWLLSVGLILGTLMGLAQMVRGEHFMSHNIWTGLIVWFVLLTFYLAWPPISKSH